MRAFSSRSRRDGPECLLRLHDRPAEPRAVADRARHRVLGRRPLPARVGNAAPRAYPGTAYVESIAGIRMGARSGLASVVTALCFVPCFFLGPLAAAVPGYATAAVLVLVGVSMFQSISTIDFSSLEDALPAFVTVVLIPLTLSITQGILWGFLLHALLYAVAGRSREVSLTLWLLAALSAGLLVLGH